MVQLLIQRLAQDTLEDLALRSQKEYRKIEKALNELEKNGLKASHVKKLAATKNIFRKRVGRWRILFTSERGTFKVWIIAMEKGTRQDYFKWILYIEKNI